jgi:uncharacterized membrane protein
VTALTVWRYPTPFGADQGELHLKQLVEQDALVVHDAASVIWMPDAEAPKVRHLRHDTARSAGRGALWGGLVGMLVLNPVAGAAAGAAATAATHRLRSTGIDEEFLGTVQEQLMPGTSALIVISSDAREELVGPILARSEATLIAADLPEEARRRLDDLLGPPP